MDNFVAWIMDEKEWLFSGAGVAGIASGIALFIRHIIKKNSASSSQKIRAGDSSVNVQAGRDINIAKKTKNDAEKG